MTDITNTHTFRRMLAQAAEYRVLQQIYRSDPQVGPKTAALLRECFRASRDDVAELRDE
jgi:hypothetical protein